MENPADLADEQSITRRTLGRKAGDRWRASRLEGALRVVFHGDLDEDEAPRLLDRFCSTAQRSEMHPFDTLAKTIRTHRDGTLRPLTSA